MKRSSYTKEFKLEAVRLLESGTKGGADIAMELGIRRNQLYKWQDEVRKKGAESSFPGKGSRDNVSDAADENARLRRELERVKEERDNLKKSYHLHNEGIAVKYQFIKNQKTIHRVSSAM